MKLRVAEILKDKGITQKELAVKIGMSEVGLSQSLNGNPTKNTLEKIADTLGVPITELFDPPAANEINCPVCGAKLTLKKRE